jgi:hypothetical protein
MPRYDFSLRDFKEHYEQGCRKYSKRTCITSKAAENIRKEQQRQKKTFDNKNMGKGADVHKGPFSLLQSFHYVIFMVFLQYIFEFLGDAVYFSQKKRGNQLHEKTSRKLKRGIILKIMSNSVQVRRGTQNFTVRRDDIRIPKSMETRAASESESKSSPVAVSRGAHRSRLKINPSNLNLQQWQQYEEEEELRREEDNAYATARRQDRSRASSPNGETDPRPSTLTVCRRKKQEEFARLPRPTCSRTALLVSFVFMYRSLAS